MRQLTLLVVLVAFTFSCGGQWMLLQGIAWTKMVRDYSQIVPFSQAVQMTLSGQYPCPICKIIAERKSPEQSKAVAFAKQEHKITTTSLVVALPLRLLSVVRYPSRDSEFSTRSDVPPTPPPRLS